MIKQIHNLLPVAAAILALTACTGGGGGGSSGGGTTGTTTSGRAVDGYLSGSTVFCDADKDGIQDTGEASTVTDGSGNFTISGACAGLIAVTGGTDISTGYAFKGLLKAAPGSAYVTPLTSLLADSGLTQAELNAALGLPANTNVTNVDPMGAGNELVLQRTLAIQQVMQQMANTLGTLSKPDAVPAIYAKVAQSLAKALRESSGTPLFTSNNTVTTSLLATALQSTVQAINTEGALPAITLNDADRTAIVAGVSTQAEQFIKAAPGGLIDLAKTLQDPKKPPVDTMTAATNYISPKNDSFMLNGLVKTLASLASPGVAADGLSTIGLEYVATGTPQIDHAIDVGMSLVSTSDDRILQVKVEQIWVKRNSTNGQVTLEVKPETQVHIYARDSRGTAFNTTLAGLSYNPLTIASNAITVNYSGLVDRVVNSANNSSVFSAGQFTNISGTFTVKFAVSNNLNVRYQDGTHLPVVQLGIFNTIKGVEGPGITGKLTIN
ncbi:MAG: hypothetical protein JWR25_815 [Noviherbaspirillum sp.]|jgi:hypothetical protein|nr:hypothetical protein [Noviherbaspirillum sp.]